MATLVSLAVIMIRPTTVGGIEPPMEKSRVLLAKKMDDVLLIRVSPKGDVLAVTQVGKGLSLWHIPSGKKLRSVPYYHALDIAFSEDGNLLAYGDRRDGVQKSVGIVRCIETKSGKQIAVLENFLENVQRLAFLPKGKILAVLSSTDGPDGGNWHRRLHQHLVLWEIGSKTKQVISKGRFSDLAVTQDGGLITIDVSADAVTPFGTDPRPCHLVRFDVPSGRKTWQIHSAPIIPWITQSENSRLIGAFRCGEQDASPPFANPEIVIWDGMTGKTLHKIPLKKPDVEALAIGFHGRLVAFSRSGGTLVFWNVDKQREILAIKLRSAVRDLVFTPDSSRLVIAGKDGTLAVWDTKTLLDKHR